jgi:hypothetical protein
MHVEILSSFVLGPGAVAEVGKVLPLQRGLALQAIAAGNARLVPDEPASQPPAEPEAPEPAVVPEEPAIPSTTPPSRSRRGAR